MLKLITHANCADGMASAILYRDLYPDAEIVFAQYGDDLGPPAEVQFIDFSPPRETAQAWVDAGAWILDHHEGAKDVVAMFGERGVYGSRPGESGAVMAYECFTLGTGRGDEDGARFAALVGIRDTWMRSSPFWEDACNLSAALSAFDLDEISMGWRARVDELIQAGRGIRRIHRKHVEQATAGGFRFATERGSRVIVFEGVTLSSDVAEALGNDVDIAVGFACFRDKTVFSMRSHAGTDILTTAKSEGGGGHAAACGFSRSCNHQSQPENPYTAIIHALRNA